MNRSHSQELAPVFRSCLDTILGYSLNINSAFIHSTKRNAQISAMNAYDSNTEDEVWNSDEECVLNEKQSLHESTNTLTNSAKSGEVTRDTVSASNIEMNAPPRITENGVESDYDGSRKRAPSGARIPEVPDNEDDYSSDDYSEFWENHRTLIPAVIPAHSAQTAVKSVVPSVKCQQSSEVPQSNLSQNCPNSEESAVVGDSDWDPRREEYFDKNNIYGLNSNSVTYVTQNYQMKDEFNICKYFLAKNGCREGKHCLYKHINPSERLYQDKDEQLVELFPRESFPIGSFVLVEITALRSPDSFYGIPLGFVSFRKPDKFSLESVLKNTFDKSPELTQLLQLSEEMGAHYSQPTAKTNYEVFPAPGSLVAFKDNTIYFRGRVLNYSDDDTLDIQCLDTGELYESFSREDVYHLEYKFGLTPAFAVHFGLANVEPHPNGWSSKFLKMFEELLMRKTFIAQILYEDEYKDTVQVELTTLHDNDELNVSEWLRDCHSAIALNDGCISENENSFLESENVFNDEQVDQGIAHQSHETQSFHSCNADDNQDETIVATTTDDFNGAHCLGYSEQHVEHPSCSGGEMDMSFDTSNNDDIVNSTFYSIKSGFEDEGVNSTNDENNVTVTGATNLTEVNSVHGGNFSDGNFLENGYSNHDEQCQSEISQESKSSLSTNRRLRRTRKRRVPLVAREIRKLSDAIYQLTISLQQSQSQNH